MTDLVFERGTPDRPLGHAFLYFRASDDTIVATYLVVPPIELDISKYVPPVFAANLGSMNLMSQARVVPVPPAPEPIELAELRRLAELRGDDILYGGSTPGDLASTMLRVVDLGEAYVAAYMAGLERAPAPPPEPAPTANPLEGAALLYSVLPVAERLEELARRMGSLRYAVEGRDRTMAESILAEMRAISAYLPADYRAAELLAAAQEAGSLGARRAELYLSRAFRLSRGELEAVADIESQIAALSTDEESGP